MVMVDDDAESVLPEYQAQTGISGEGPKSGHEYRADGVSAVATCTFLPSALHTSRQHAPTHALELRLQMCMHSLKPCLRHPDPPDLHTLPPYIPCVTLEPHQLLSSSLGTALQAGCSELTLRIGKPFSIHTPAPAAPLDSQHAPPAAGCSEAGTDPPHRQACAAPAVSAHCCRCCCACQPPRLGAALVQLPPGTSGGHHPPPQGCLPGTPSPRQGPIGGAPLCSPQTPPTHRMRSGMLRCSWP
eukprot:1153246-Pelagomonas_calceolata.AAC.2